MPQRDIASFIAYWSAASASERSHSQRFLLELCELLAVPAPDHQPDAGYFFEYPVTEHHPDGSTSQGRIDLYKRGCFVLESKQFQEARARASQLELAAEDAGVVARKKSSQPVRGTSAWDDALLRARGQAERYVRALPASEPNPPFLLVVDVGHTFELYADFTQAGKAYLPFPDPRTFRLRLADLADERVRERLRLIWTNPAALDPARHSADVTREVSAHLAALAKSLEDDGGHDPAAVAQFLTRCLFCMFAEDIGLLPDRAFTELLAGLPPDGTGFPEVMQQLFRELNTGTGQGISVVLRKQLLQFNGGLFASDTVLPLNRLQLGLLKEAARQNWRTVEPAIFGTLLERALNPAERHQLGAHFTPRAYVERLVLPTVIEPLRADWENVRAAAVTHARAGELKAARAAVNAFHDHLCRLRVLDPACGTGNFLYVALQHLKVLEGEVLDVAAQFGENFKLELATHTIDPHQFLGLELNPRAAAIAELVLWIGYLQWHFRLHGQRTPPEPILRAFKNIECRDAVLAYDGEPQPVTWAMAQENPNLPGLPDAVRSEIRNPQSAIRNETITVWDRRSFKPDPVTGRDVPDETQRVPLLAYPNPRPAQWPQADFIIGNPPFLGNKRMRGDLGDGYAETLRAAYSEVPESADFVLYWWHKAAALVRTGQARRFGLITTNSLRQTFARRVVRLHLECGDMSPLSPAATCRGETKRGPVHAVPDAGTTAALPPQSAIRNPHSAIPAPLSLVFAIPDHPWVDTADGAAVRIAMTVGVAGELAGELLEVTEEQSQGDGSTKVALLARHGRISADISIGADVGSTVELDSNCNLSNQGVTPLGTGFRLSVEEAKAHISKNPAAQLVLKPYAIGRDIVQESEARFIIDFFGLAADEARTRFPDLFQHVLNTVKPERDQKERGTYREKWWLFAEPRANLRPALNGLKRYIATCRTAKHRVFVFLDGVTIPDAKIVAIGLDDSLALGVLSSRIHGAWALATGSFLEDRPNYNHSECFAKFPFPLCDEAAKARIRTLAEELDAHRKRVQAQHPGLTLTGLYNVLEKLRSGGLATAANLPTTGEETTAHPKPDRRNPATVARPPLLTPKEKLIHDQGLVSVLKQLHDDLDAAVFAAYGWPATLTDAEILERLVALNAARAAEEKRGVIHWLRPEYQCPPTGNPTSETRNPKVQATLDLPATPAEPKRCNPQSAIRNPKLKWPKPLADRVRAVETALHAAAGPATPTDLAQTFTRAQPAAIAEILETLVTLGRARKQGTGFTP